ncbi:unnamed protein product [Protopolystoma xenopodis]|uniref:Protein kinase domain-containing protein n=1 Tax=Protopolystoma xenopodis TaxID=117903 RepID=A0A448WR35_9PLAT|nr:unnamed protein product [Protopolystoma xenopodis]
MSISQFSVKRNIKAGSLSKVVFAVREHDNQSFILKIVPKTLLHDSNSLPFRIGERSFPFPSEALILEKLKHLDCCVKLLHVIDDNDSNAWVLVLEDLTHEGYVNLAEELGLRKSFDEATVSWIILGLIKCISDIHSLGILHCDIKPDNIFINHATKSVKIIDFNVAIDLRNSDPKTLKLPYCTPDYAPPEILIHRNPWSTSSEVWSVGCTAFVLLCGKFPFSNPWDSLHVNPSYPLSTSQDCDSVISYAPNQSGHGDVVISNKALDFLHITLCRSVQHRPCLDKLAQHAFLKLGASKSKSNSRSLFLPYSSSAINFVKA